MNKLANKENLKPLSTNKAREIGKKGGIASGESRRKRKAMREQLETILSMPVTLKDENGNKLIDKYKKLGINETDIDNQMAISIELFLTAISDSKSKIQAIKEIREIIHDTEVEEQNKEIRVTIINDLEDYEGDENK